MKPSALRLRRAFISGLVGALLLPVLASCGGGGGKSGVTTVPAVTFPAPAGEESLAGLTDPYCTNQRLFESGGRANYRIPGIFTTNDGTLVAAVTQRMDTTDDNAPEKYVVVRRSTDGGLTWTESSYLTHVDGYETEYCGGVYDSVRDVIHIFLATTALSEQAKKNQTSGTVANRPYTGPFDMRSADGGETWQFYRYTRLADAEGQIPNIYGNDHGVQIPTGPYAGRLVVGARHKGRNYLMYSDDGGDTWMTGAKAQENTGECSIAVLPDGALYVNSRTYNDDGKRLEGWSFDGGKTLVQMQQSADLIEPAQGCNASVITIPHPETGENILLYSGINMFIPNVTSSLRVRVNLCVWISYDEGKSWPVCKQIEADRSAYSTMTYDPATGLIYILYETGHEALYDRGLNLMTCNLAWLESDAPCPEYVFTQPAGTWQERASNCFAGGTGTADDPYLVATAEQLALLARLTNYGENLSGVCFKQTADIDLAGCEWTPIGRASSWCNVRVDPDLPKAPFSGTYDGDGHVIESLTADTLQRSGVGLFGYVENATIRNVMVKDGNVHGAVRSSGVVGWICGSVDDTTVVENCFYYGRTSYDYPTVGGTERYLFDVGYRNGEACPGDISTFPSYSAKVAPKTLLPTVEELTWISLAADEFAGGDGSAEDPYQIATAEQLALLAKMVNAGDTQKGRYFRLTAHIDLSGSSWVPIGMPNFDGPNHLRADEEHISFEGVLDGDGYTVSGMNVSIRGYGAGFFSYLCGGTVRNLAVKGSVAGTCCVGGFVGFLRPNAQSPTTIENCYFEGTVSGEGGNVGGFIGRLHQTSGCAGASSNSPTFGILRNLYCKATVRGDATDVTVTLLYGGQYSDRASWTAVNCCVVNDLPENAGIAINRDKCHTATPLTSEQFASLYSDFSK